MMMKVIMIKENSGCTGVLKVRSDVRGASIG